MAIPFSYSFRSIAVRKTASLMAVLGIALVVLVFNVLLALAAGFRRAVATSGNPQNLIVQRKGAESELGSQVSRAEGRILEDLPCVARGADGERLFLFESVLVILMQKLSGGDANITVRGTCARSLEVRRDVHLVQGRWFNPGSEEAVIGRSLIRRLSGAGLGQTLSAGQRTWRIVGVFEAAGSALESEAWIDGEVLQGVFKRDNTFQSFLFRAAGDPQAAKGQLETLFESDPRLRSYKVETEQEYYEKQSRLMAGVITALGNLLTGIMAVGAVVGAMNTMYAAVSQRKREIGCLLAIGFTPFSVWSAFMLEALLLSVLGALAGCGASFLFDGMKTGTTNFATFSETAFEMRLTAANLTAAVGVALAIGFLGGLLPAVRAANLRVVEALKRE
jgi:putative ABC transport system permease protein